MDQIKDESKEQIKHECIKTVKGTVNSESNCKVKSSIPVYLNRSIRMAGFFGFFLGATLILTLIKVSLCTPFEKAVNCTLSSSFDNASRWLIWLDDTKEAIKQYPVGFPFFGLMTFQLARTIMCTTK